jgi:ABC-type Fe3+/spermidine/putrescine transport system ATPase subunit
MSDAAHLPFLAIRGVSKRFAVGDGEIEALARVDLEIARGQFACLIGASGCGKSTLLRIVAGFEEQSSGEISVHGKAITGPASDRGMVFQEYALFPWMTVRQNISFGPRQRGKRGAELDAIAGRIHQAGRPGALHRALPEPALGRHEAARGDRARARERG